MNVLNPGLYRALELRYSYVSVVNEGQVANINYRPSYRQGKAKLSVEATGGEYYKVNCSFCNDTRQRLNFSYLWGSEDERTGQRLLHLAHCFNDDCLDDWSMRQRLYDRLFAPGRRRRHKSRVRAAAAGLRPPPPKKIALPGDSVPVGELPCGHAAREYLESRDFDVDELWRRWRVWYCESDTAARPQIRSRIVVPVYRPKTGVSLGEDGKLAWNLAGWQARVVDDAHGMRMPKYLTAAGMRKSELLYGLPRACRGDGPVVVVEGVTDVWRLGRDAVAAFGKKISAIQLRLLAALFQGRPIVIAFDRDAAQESEVACASLRSSRNELDDAAPTSVLTLPGGRADVGECPRQQAWAAVRRSL